MAKRRKGESMQEMLRAAIEERGTSYRELAERAHVPHPTISRFMSGERGLSLDTAELLAVELGLSLSAGAVPGDTNQARRRGRSKATPDEEWFRETFDRVVDRPWFTMPQLYDAVGKRKTAKFLRMCEASPDIQAIYAYNGEKGYTFRSLHSKKVPLRDILAEFEPLLKELESEGKKEHMAEYCPSIILNITFKIRKLLKDRST